MQTDTLTAWCQDECPLPGAIQTFCDRPDGHAGDHFGTDATGVDFLWRYG